MRLLFITPSFSTRGARVSLIELIGGLIKTQDNFSYEVWGVGSLSDTDKDLWNRYGVSDNVRVFPTESHLGDKLLDLDKELFSVCIFHELFPLCSFCTPRTITTPIVVMPRCPSKGLDGALLSKLDCDRIIYPSEYARNSFRGYREVIPTEILPTGIDTDYYKAFKVTGRNYGTAFSCGFSGKSSDELLSHFGLDFPSDVLTTHSKNIERIAHSSFVLALDTNEGFGRIPVEAACMGIPTIAVNDGALPELRLRGLPMVTFDSPPSVLCRSNINTFIHHLNGMGSRDYENTREHLQSAAIEHFDHKQSARKFMNIISTIKGIKL